MKNCHYFDSPIGRLRITENGKAISGIALCSKPGDAQEKETPLLAEAIRQLDEYFAGSRTGFELPLDPEGTPFQKKIWDCLREIPYGETRSYKQVAQMAGSPSACRAVGLANNRNPLMIVVPCHRVVGSDGSMTGYAGGIDKKEFLLRLEKGME